MSLKTALLLGSTGETGRELLKQLVASPSYDRYVCQSQTVATVFLTVNTMLVTVATPCL